MKLLKTFRDVLEDLGNIKTAWFTSFNLSPGFIETYILPELTYNREKPLTLRQFEAIQQSIIDKNMDIRFFCDASMYELSETKKTSVPIQQLRADYFGKEYKGGFFHPKVALLINKNNDAYVIAGSANLTVSGWGRNREGVIAKKIRGQKNANAVRNFFKNVIEAAGDEIPNRIVINTSYKNESWKFTSILTHEPFLNELLNGNEEALYIWTPYLSQSPSKFIKNHVSPLTWNNLKTVVFPDLSSGKVRLAPSAKEKETLINSKEISFRRYNFGNKKDSETFSHAKIWMTDKKTAIGSWNFTEAGTGAVYGESPVNIEAGIILNESSLPALKKHAKLDLEYNLMTADEINDEKLITISNFPFFIRVVFNWSERRYYYDFQKRKAKGHTLRLPDASEDIQLEKGGTLDINHPEKLVRDRIFHVLKKNEVVFSGVIIEENISERPVWKFDNLEDLFQSIVTGEEAGDRQCNALTYKTEDPELEMDSDPSDPGTDIQLQKEASNYSLFRMFTAFKNYETIIKNIRQNTSFPEELRKHIRVYPGSLTELKDKIDTILKHGEDSPSKVYRWFLANEFNLLINKVRKIYRKSAYKDGSIHIKPMLSTLRVRYRIKTKDEDTLAYLEYLKTKCGYKKT